MQQTLFCLAAVFLLSIFSLSRHRGLAADEQAEIRRATESAALATAERWAAVLQDAAVDDVDGYHGLDATDTARAGMGLVSVRVRVAVSYADRGTFAPAGDPKAAKTAVVTVTEIRADGRVPAEATLSVRVTPAGQFLHS